MLKLHKIMPITCIQEEADHRANLSEGKSANRQFLPGP